MELGSFYEQEGRHAVMLSLKECCLIMTVSYGYQCYIACMGWEIDIAC